MSSALRNLFFWAATSLLVLPNLVWAQTFPIFQENTGVASLDRERLYRDSNFGQKKLDEIERRSEALTEENRRIQSELEAEERALTEQRKTLEADAFAVLAEAFDQKVKRLRVEQDEKRLEIRASLDAAEREFNQIAAPILRQLMRDRGITFILDQSAIILSLADGDITDEALAIINSRVPLE